LGAISIFQIVKHIHALHRVRVKSTPEQIRAIQRENLERLIRHAVERAPFYRKLYDGIDLDRFGLEDLPPVTKRMLMENFNDAVTVDDLKIDEVAAFIDDPGKIGQLLKDRYIPAHTSGTTGIRGYFINNIQEWTFSQALAVVREGKVKVPPSVVILPLRPFWKFHFAVITATGGHFASYLLQKVTSSLRERLARIWELSILTPVDELIDVLNRIKPYGFLIYPSVLDELAQAQLEGRLRIKPTVIAMSGEPFTDQARRRTERAFPKAILIETYGTTECVAMAKECSEGFLHVNSDQVILESVDEHGRAVPEGAEGDKVFLTNLYNYTQPLIRYEITDSVTYLPGTCACESSLPRVRVHGRTNDALRFADRAGRPVSILPIPFLLEMIRVEGVKQYQIVQRARNALIVRYTPEPGFDRGRIEAGVREVYGGMFARNGLGDAVSMDFEVVSELPRDPRSGKVKQVVTELDA